MPGADVAVAPGPADQPPRTAGGRWRAAGGAALAAVAVVILVTAFHDSGNGRANTTGPTLPAGSRTSATTSAPTSSAPSTTVAATTTAALPSAPQSSPDGAATVLISAWASGNQARALSVAAPAAVATLFGAHYQSGLAVDRGCSSHAPPETCAFGPPGGASPTDPLYSLTVSQAPGGGWYVSAVQILG